MKKVFNALAPFAFYASMFLLVIAAATGGYVAASIRWHAEVDKERDYHYRAELEDNEIIIRVTRETVMYMGALQDCTAESKLDRQRVLKMLFLLHAPKVNCNDDTCWEEE